MKIAVFGSSLVSAYWNGAATYYRGVLKALARRGHQISFYEPDAFERQQHRDIEDPPWAKVVVYQATEEAALRALHAARDADLLVKASGVGVFDELLEAALPSVARPGASTAFWDVDAPATLARVEGNPDDPFARLIPTYDFVLLYGGGPPAIDRYTRLGARSCTAIYNAADIETHHPVAPDARFASDLAFLGNRLPDREQRVEDFFLAAARSLPDRRFLLGGNGWHDKALPANVQQLGHVYTADHNALNVTPRAILNIARDSMVSCGFSPATRVFEAAAAGACLITDAWEGVEAFFEPGREILVAHDGQEVAAHVESLSAARASEIGARALRRVRAQHQYQHRALDFERAVGCAPRAKVQRRPAARARDAGRTSAGGSQLRIVVLGLSITSSWGNGHATTYRSLLGALSARGHDVTFLERDTPWYAEHRDVLEPSLARVHLYKDVRDLRARFAGQVRDADLVIVGSYVPDGIEIGAWVLDSARGVRAFYDIDTPVTLADLARGACTYVTPRLIAGYDLYLSFTGGPTLAALERTHGARRARALYCTADAAAYVPVKRSARWDLGYLGTYSADRQPALERLLVGPATRAPDQRLVVAGAQYPAELAWPANVRRIEHVAPREHGEFYSRLRFNLNVTRERMIAAGYSPSVRLFEAAACGVATLSDAWSGLDAFFEPGREILIVRSAEDVARALRELSEHERAAIGASARERFLAEHTAAHRARTLESYLEQLHTTDTLTQPTATL
jgi:spore maturation protein CgeB